jgi:glutathione S-transferase|uniref:glutathione S-transferase family protein n=1 Tax=Halomonas sp. TaxID=1486246 RepID=UPI0026150563|nr:glutathione S-transferase [Halomonas sp.]
MRLLGRNNSVNVKKVMWCAHELGLQLERADMGGPFGGLDSTEYQALNPNRLIPVLEDGELVVWESNAILRYLLATYGDGKLGSHSPASLARSDMWMDWVLSTLSGPFRDLFQNKVRKTEETRDHAAMARGLAVTGEKLAVVDHVLAEQEWLSGNEFAIGDIPMGCYAYGWFNMDIERPELPHLEAWYQRLTQRPGYQTHVMLPLT